MKSSFFLLIIMFVTLAFVILQKKNAVVEEPVNLTYNNTMEKLNKLSDAEKNIILGKGTEAPFSGEYDNFYETGIYICKQCNAPLYTSESKFKSGCGWPSFDEEIPNRVLRFLDADGRRTEIVCAQCKGHLGHVFEGEQLTDKNIRHCVNSVSIKFIPKEEANDYKLTNLKKTYFAAGCFWGVEHLLQKQIGVLEVVSGYMGGKSENPSYQEVSSKASGHLEVVEVTYNPELINYESLVKFFFEIHDPTQENGQGPDIGPQYLSAIFYENSEEKEIAQKVMRILEEKKYKLATQLREKESFWKAEDYHQDYYAKNGKAPYCHSYGAKF